MQSILFARGVARNDGRHLQSGEYIRLVRCHTGIGADVSPEQQSTNPDTPEPAIRGRTTQKRLSAAVKLFASFFSCTLTSTCERSSLSMMDCTVPISTSLYLTLVLPASSPSAELNIIVISGPCCTQVLIAIEIPITAASMGISQINEGIQSRCRTFSGAG